MIDPKAEKQRAIVWEEMMLIDPHIAYTKKIGIAYERITRVLM